MELEEFISKTLISVAKGIKAANKEIKDGEQSLFAMESSSWYKDRSDSCIKFDVAVTTTNETGAKGSGGIKVLSIGMDGQMETNTSNQVVSRIKFNVAPIITIG